MTVRCVWHRTTPGLAVCYAEEDKRNTLNCAAVVNEQKHHNSSAFRFPSYLIYAPKHHTPSHPATPSHTPYLCPSVCKCRGARWWCSLTEVNATLILLLATKTTPRAALCVIDRCSDCGLLGWGCEGRGGATAHTSVGSKGCAVHKGQLRLRWCDGQCCHLVNCKTYTTPTPPRGCCQGPQPKLKLLDPTDTPNPPASSLLLLPLLPVLAWPCQPGRASLPLLCAACHSWP